MLNTNRIKQLLIAGLCLLNVTAFAQRDIPVTNELKITGDIKAERIFRIADLEKMKPVDLGDVAIKNHKGEDKTPAKQIKGILVKSLLDSVEFVIEKPKELSEYYLVFIASDGYTNVYSWNEIFNTEIGNKLYILTEKDGKHMSDMDGRIQVLSMADFNTGRRYLKGLATIEIKRVKH